MGLTFIQRLQIDGKRRKEWYSVLASMTDAATRMPLAPALKEMSREFAQHGQPMGPLVDEVIGRMTGTRAVKGVRSLRLGDSLAGLVPAAEATMVKTGEERGDVSRGLHQAAYFVGAIDGLVASVRKAMGLSILYAGTIFAMFAFFSLELLPQMELTVKRMLWPASAQRFGYVADHIFVFAGTLIAFFTIGWFVVKWLAAHWGGRGRDFADQHVFPFKTIRLMNASAMLMALSGFIKAGAPFDTAITSMLTTANPYMKSRLERTLRAGKLGMADFDALLASGLIPKNRYWILRCYGKTADFGDAIDKIAQDFVEFATFQTTAMAKILNLVFMLVTAANLAWVISVIASIVKSVR